MDIGGKLLFSQNGVVAKEAFVVETIENSKHFRWKQLRTTNVRHAKDVFNPPRTRERFRKSVKRPPITYNPFSQSLPTFVPAAKDN